MVKITIDPEACKHDGICVRICPDAVFVQKEKDAVPEPLRSDLCISCGQCVAICPHDAITHSEFPAGSIHEIQQQTTPTYGQLMALLHTRRACRSFQDEPVKKEHIRQIIEAARFAPSALNAQSTRYLVIQDVLMLTEISDRTNAFLVAMVESLRKANPDSELEKDHAYNVIKMKISEVGYGTDVYLHNAPALIIFHADRHASMGGISASLAVENAALAAETLGIGAFYSGFVLFAIRHDPSFKKLLGVPDSHEVHGALALGYPKLKFRKWIERRPAQITWK